MEGAGIRGFQALLLWEEAGLQCLAKRVAGTAAALPSSPWISSTGCLLVLVDPWGLENWSQWGSAPLPVLAHRWLHFQGPGDSGVGAVWGHSYPCAAHAKRRERFPPVLSILVSYLGCSGGLNMSWTISPIQTLVVLEKKGWIESITGHGKAPI